MGDKPLIGVSAGFQGFGDYAGVGYQRALVMAGAVPMLFSRVPGGLDDQLDRVDGVMLAAGTTSTRLATGRRRTRCWGRSTLPATASRSSWSSGRSTAACRSSAPAAACRC